MSEPNHNSKLICLTQNISIMKNINRNKSSINLASLLTLMLVLYFSVAPIYAQQANSDRTDVALENHRGIFKPYTKALNKLQQHYLTALELNDNADYQLITIDRDALIRGGDIVINLKDGRNINLFPLDQRTKIDGRLIWKGESDAYEGSVKFIVNDDKITAGIRLIGAYYRILPLSGGLHVLFSNESVGYKECALHGKGGKGATFRPERHILPVEDGSSENEGGGNQGMAVAAECKIRFLYAYTPAVAAASADIVSVIETDTDDFNDINSNSGVDFEVEIARIVEMTGYVEVNTTSTDPLGNGWQTANNLVRFWDTNDGFMDEVHDLRDLYDADMCQLYTTQLSGFGGFAMDVNIGAADAFCASLWNNGGFTISHEFGHLIGMWHDTGNSPTNVPFAFGHGFFNDNTDAGTNFRTVMSYSNNCSGVCGVIPNWSNPTVNFGGNPTGTAATHDNARVARIRDAPISNFQGNVANKSVLSDTVDDEETADVYGSTSISTSNNNVVFESGSVGTYRAGQQIRLLPGFHAKHGTVFNARIDMACSGLNRTEGDDGITQRENEMPSNVPAQLSLECYPNPFQGSTTVSYNLPQNGMVSIAVFDNTGREVIILENEVTKGKGEYQLEFNAINLPNGIYFIKLVSDQYNATRKLIIN